MADFEATAVTINDFTGGMTDFFLDGAKEEYQRAENFLLTPDKKLSTRPGSRIESDLIYQIPSGNHRVGAMFTYDDDGVMFIQSERNIYARTASITLQTIANPNPALGFNELGNYIAYAFWNHHTFITSDSLTKPIKVFKTGNSYVVRTAGLPTPTAPILSGTAGANNYLYAVTFAVAYTINAPDPIVFEDESAPVFIEVDNVNAPDVNPVNFTNIQSITNGSVNNYDTANIKIRIYRTENNQTAFFFVGEVSNGTTVFSDTTSDADLILSTELYTNGGVPANDEPPAAKFVHILNDTAYYGGIVEDGQLLGNRMRQSVPGNPDAVPASFNSDVQQDITGYSSYAGNLIVFTANKVYRAIGSFDELGNGGTTFEEISETIGSVNHLGIVQTKVGVFFPGIDGFYWTDGFSVRRISEKIINTYKTATTTSAQKGKIYATYDKNNNRVIWSMMSNTGAVDNDALFILDLRFGVRDNSSITTWTGTSSFSPTAICIFEGVFRRGDRRGYLFKHTSNILTDPQIDISTTPDNWLQDTIIYDYRSTAMNFGMPDIRKWVSKVVASLRNVSNVSLQIYSINDDSNNMQPLVEIRDDSQPVWGDSTIVWGNAECIWNFFPLIETFRRFPRNKLRCSYKQLRFTNALTIVSESDTLGVVTVDPVLKTATLATATRTWPANSVGYSLSFENDNYTKQFLVTSQTDTILTFADPDSAAPAAGNYKWLLKGYAKNQTLSLLAYVIYFAPISKTFTPFNGNLGQNQ